MIVTIYSKFFPNSSIAIIIGLLSIFLSSRKQSITIGDLILSDAKIRSTFSCIFYTQYYELLESFYANRERLFYSPVQKSAVTGMDKNLYHLYFCF